MPFKTPQQQINYRQQYVGKNRSYYKDYAKNYLLNNKDKYNCNNKKFLLLNKKNNDYDHIATLEHKYTKFNFN